MPNDVAAPAGACHNGRRVGGGVHPIGAAAVGRCGATVPMKPKKPRWRSRVLSADEVSLAGECRYIAELAEQCEPRVVTLGPLVLFSTETGDAWMLDPADDRALCLVRARSPVAVQIDEKRDSVSVDWTHTYRIHAELMTFTAGEGDERTVWGYPTREIGLAIRRVSA